MRRSRAHVLPVLLLLGLLASACGESGNAPPVESGPGPATTAAAGAFRLVVPDTGVSNRPAPILVEGDSTGVTVRIRRASSPQMLFESWFLPVSPSTPLPRWGEARSIRLDARTEPCWPTLESGLYLITASRGEERQLALLAITDLGLIVRRSDDEVLVFVVEAVSGAAAPGAQVSVLGPLERRAGPADSRGVFRATMRPGPELRVIAYRGEQIGIGSSGPDPELGDDGLSTLRTDRAVCAPGDRVAFAGVLRFRSNGRIRPVPAEEGRFEVRSAVGRVLAAGPVRTGPGGTIAGSFCLPGTLRDGALTLLVTVRDRTIARDLEARRPFPAPFEVEIVAGDEPLQPGERGPFAVEARRTDGSPLPGAAVRYEVWRGERPVVEGEAALDTRGVFRSSFPVEREGEYEVRAAVTGPDLQAVAKARTLRTSATRSGLRLVLESRLLEPGREAVVRIVADGAGPFSGKLQVQEVGGAGHQEFAFSIPAGARETPVRFVPAGHGHHTLAARAGDARGREVRAAGEVWVLDDRPFGEEAELALVADRDRYSPREQARLLLLLPSDLSGCELLETLEGRSLGPHRAEKRIGPQHLIRFRVPDDQGEEIRYGVRGIRSGRPFQAEVVLAVDQPEGGLEVELAAADGITARVVDREGRRVPSQVLFSLPAGSGWAEGGLSPWLRTDADGRTPAWRPPASGGWSGEGEVHALAAALDGRMGGATIRVANGAAAPDAARSRSEPPAGATPQPAIPTSRDFRMPVASGTVDRWIDFPEGTDLGAVSLRIHLTSNRRSELLPALDLIESRVTGSTVRALPPLLRRAAARIFADGGLLPFPGLESDPEAASRARADLLHLRDGEGRWGHFPGDAPDPELSVLVPAVLREADPDSGSEAEFGSPPPESLDPADRPRRGNATLAEVAAALARLADLPGTGEEDGGEVLVRVRVNDAVVGSVRLVPGDPAREHRRFDVPASWLRPTGNRIEITAAGPGAALATVIVSSPGPVGGPNGPLSLTRQFRPEGPVLRGSRLTASLEIRAATPLERILVRCPLPGGARLAAWPELPRGVAFEEREGAIDLFLRELNGPGAALRIELPLLVITRGTWSVPPATATLLEAPGTRAHSTPETLLFR